MLQLKKKKWLLTIKYRAIETNSDFEGGKKKKSNTIIHQIMNSEQFG